MDSYLRITHHNPEDLDLKLHCCEILKTRILCVSSRHKRTCTHRWSSPLHCRL